MVDYIFYLCVDILFWLAKLTGTSYELINIIIFIVLYPLILLFLLIVIMKQRKQIKNYK